MNSCTDTDNPLRLRRKLVLDGPSTALLLLAVLVLVGSGCGRGQPSPGSDVPQQSSRPKKVSDDLMHHAIDALYRLEEFQGGEMLQRTLDRLAQWAREQKPIADWKPDPMLATLPKALAELPAVKDLGKLGFTPTDGFALQEAIWLRDASNWAKAGDVHELARSKDLFDWTVRNIQADSNRASGPVSERVLQSPWETLLLGRGTAWERAWVFVLLARQQGIDAFVLGLPAANAPASDNLEPWAVAILSEGEFYLFEPVLGFPIPGPAGIQLNDQGQLDIKPASLSQLVADEKLLKQLDVDAEHPYPVTSARLKNVVALLEASPAYLQQNMAMIESRLVGTEKVVLTAAPSAQAERLKDTRQVQNVRLWTLPYDQIAQRKRLGDRAVRWQQIALLPFQAQAGEGPALWKGRVLHLKGIFTGDSNAVTYYQLARPSDRELAAAHLPRPMQEVYLLAKLDASYWLGLIAQTQGNYRSAIDYLSNRTLLQALDNGPWTYGARYNLGRAYEAERNYAKALDAYRTKTSAPDYSGNLLRARWLESQTLAKGSPATPAASEGKPPAQKPAEETPALPTLPTLPEK